LRHRGWVEVQDLCLSRIGRPIVNTCKGATRKDYLWLSPELALGFLDLHVDSETFADHAVLVASFAGGRAHLERFVWPCPKPVPWSKVSVMSESVPFCSPHDPTRQYAHLWQCKETQAQQDLAEEWMPCMAGRAAQTKPRRVTGSQAPLKQGRAGDIQPGFLGFSAVHAKQFKQLRRLQNYCRCVDNRVLGLGSDVLHGVCLWNSILRAPGRLVLPRLFLRGGRLGCMSAHLIQTTCLNMVPALLLLTKFMKPSLLKSGCSNNG
jgi:hypothetical protein